MNLRFRLRSIDGFEYFQLLWHNLIVLWNICNIIRQYYEDNILISNNIEKYFNKS